MPNRTAGIGILTVVGVTELVLFHVFFSVFSGNVKRESGEKEYHLSGESSGSRR